MLCRDLMRRPVQRATPQESAQAVASRMRDSNIGFIPVCDERDRLVGVVTDRDLAVRVCAPARSAAEVPIGEVLSPTEVACRPDDDVREAEQLMVENRVSRLVVTDASGRVEGVISLSDVAMADQARAADVLREVASRELLDAGGETQPSL